MEEPAIRKCMLACCTVVWRNELDGIVFQLVVSIVYCIGRADGRRSPINSFQEVQNHSTLIASLYLLPNLIIGVGINLSVGIFVDRLPAGWLVVWSSLLCALAPLMMALVNPSWKYYYLELWAQILAPLSADVLYTVGLIIVSDSFPERTQALAGAVFSTAAQFGTSLGVGICQVVALGVIGNDVGLSSDSRNTTNQYTSDMLSGYRAAFWAMFAEMMCCVLIAVVGLRRTGRVGLKKD